jgi:hypothetical protein
MMSSASCNEVQMFDALYGVHAKVTHGDVTAANFIWDPSGHFFQLVDFEFASWTERPALPWAAKCSAVRASSQQPLLRPKECNAGMAPHLQPPLCSEQCDTDGENVRSPGALAQSFQELSVADRRHGVSSTCGPPFSEALGLNQGHKAEARSGQVEESTGELCCGQRTGGGSARWLEEDPARPCNGRGGRHKAGASAPAGQCEQGELNGKAADASGSCRTGSAACVRVVSPALTFLPLPEPLGEGRRGSHSKPLEASCGGRLGLHEDAWLASQPGDVTGASIIPLYCLELIRLHCFEVVPPCPLIPHTNLGTQLFPKLGLRGLCPQSGGHNAQPRAVLLQASPQCT